MIKSIMIVFLGSGVGGALRYIVTRAIQGGTHTVFPIGTFTVNIIGCLLFGLLYGLFERGAFMSANARLLLTVGLCGGFTTFSTFMNENFTFLRTGNVFMFSIYTAVSVFFGFMALYIGSLITK